MTANLDDKFNRPVAPAPVSEACSAILAALEWGEKVELQTKVGPRLLSKAYPNQAFYDLWRRESRALQAAGYNLKKNERMGLWEVCFWEHLPKKILEDREAAKAASRAVDANAVIPAPEGLEYLGYQKAGILWANSRPSSLIGDEMGLGKTIQAIGLMNMDPSLRRVLIICPASLKLNWRRELEKWLIRKRPILVCDSKMFVAMVDGISIVNYDVLQKHDKALHDVTWDLVVCDEAHYLKGGAKTIRGKMVFGAPGKKKGALDSHPDAQPIIARKRVLLTGTPIANRPAELFPLISYLDAVTWPNFSSFAKRYCAAHNNGFGWDVSGSSNLEELQDRLRSSILIRRLKKDVLTELPPKRRQVIEFTPTGSAKQFIEAEQRKYAEREPELARLEAAAELAKASENEEAYKDAVGALKKATSVAFDEMSAVRKATGVELIAMPSVIEFLEEAVEASGKLIIFAHHKDVVSKLRASLAKYGAVEVIGDTPMEERQANVDRFQQDPACRVIIGGFQPMGTGWTLVASSHVIFVELDWVPGNVSQGEDRAHRIGQKDSVLIQHLVLEGSLAATMAKRIVEKQNVIDKALDSRERLALEGAPVGTKDKPASALSTREQLREEGRNMTAEQVDAAHAAMKRLSAVCNGARDWDGMGFSKIDTNLGKSLAVADFLSAGQAALAKKIALKYRKQLGEEWVAKIKGEAA